MSQLNYRLRAVKSQAALEQQTLDTGKYQNVEKLMNYLQGLQAGADQSIVEVAEGSEAADGTFTMASSGASSVTIDGTTLTGGTDYAIANLSAAQVAANLANAINASVDQNVQLVDAQVSGAVVTVTARAGGIIGNKIAISATGAAAASGAVLAGGTAGTLKILKFNLSL